MCPDAARRNLPTGSGGWTQARLTLNPDEGRGGFAGTEREGSEVLRLHDTVVGTALGGRPRLKDLKRGGGGEGAGETLAGGGLLFALRLDINGVELGVAADPVALDDLVRKIEPDEGFAGRP